MRSRVLTFFCAAAFSIAALADPAKGTNDQVFRLRKTTHGIESLLVVYEDGKVNHIYHGYGETPPKVQSYSIWRSVSPEQIATILQRLQSTGIETIKSDPQTCQTDPELTVYMKGWEFFGERPLPKDKQAAISAIADELFKQLNLDKPTPKDFTPR
jgi:hypothetical protein